MFDFVRKHTKILQLVLFLLIFPSFVLMGVEGYNSSRDTSPVAGEVDGHDITQTEWDAAHKREVERLRPAMPNVDAKLLDTPQARYNTLERLVRERVLATAALKLKLGASDARLAQTLQQDASIAALRRPDGTLDVERYRQLLAAQGMSPEMFEAQVRSDLSARQVLGGVSNTSFSTTALADASIKALFERREVQIARYNPTDFQAQVKLTDADLESYYQSHASLFQAPEQVNIEYVMLDVEALKKSVHLNEEDLKTYYKQNIDRLAGQEERRASHILIAATKDASAAERKQARAKADELLAAVRKAPDSFAELARKNSQDSVSAANGGDLDFFRRGAMTKPFEEAAFALKKGDISDVVETEFGYHIIRLADIKAPKIPSFEELRPRIEADQLKEQAQRKFTEVAESFTNAVYEQSDSYKAIADQLKLTVQTANGLTRNPAPGATGPLANPKFLNALFAGDALEKKRNTEAVEVGSSQLVSGRVLQHTPAHTLPLAEVKEAVRNRLLAERAAELARKTGETQLAAWRAEPTKAQLPAAINLSRDESQQQPPKLIEAVLRVDPATLPAWVGVDLGAQGYAVVRVQKLVPRATDSADTVRKNLAQYTQLWAAAEAQAYYRHLQSQYGAQIKAAKPEIKAGVAP